MNESITPTECYLAPISGPALGELTLIDRPGGVTVGRSHDCDLHLPESAVSVSRRHAKFWRDGVWRVLDLGSRMGTFVNGVKLGAEQGMELHEADHVRIGPWTFVVSATRGGQSPAQDDAGPEDAGKMIRTIALDAFPRIELLELFMQTAQSLDGATDERELASRIVNAAGRGTGFQNASLLRALDREGNAECLASNRTITAGEKAFSRSLVRAASTGKFAELGSLGEDRGQSIAEMGIVNALCVPLMLDGAPVAFLYLDSRGAPQAQAPHAKSFCVALSQLGGLAIGNLRRVDVQRRNAKMEADLEAAAVAQRWVMPQRIDSISKYACDGKSRPGQYVGGDFFDVIDLGNDRVAIALGDVSGKGIPASVLMTASQGFLHAILRERGDPALAANLANRFLHARRPGTKFVTAWIGILDARLNQLTYVDAGHGYAWLASEGNEPVRLMGEGLPLAVDEESEYVATTVPLPEQGRLLVVSDGIVEQPSAEMLAEAGRREQFGMERVTEFLTAGGELGELFARVEQFAGSTKLADDATVTRVTW